jgi:hypothetical protein
MGKHAEPRTDPQLQAATQRAVLELQNVWAHLPTGRPGAPPSPPATNTRKSRRRWAIACRASAAVLDREGRPEDAGQLRALAEAAEIPLPDPTGAAVDALPFTPRSTTEAMSQAGGRT